MAEIQLEDVYKIYPDGTEAVASLDLGIGDGEFMVLVGPSGCGKTTALRMVAGLEEISKGTVRIGGREVNELAPRDRDIAMVFQSYALYPHLSVYDNMAFALKLRKVPKQEIDKRVRDAARILGLEDFLHRRPRALSGGQRQRVAMGRAIVREPQAFLMDEPLSNLDAKLRVQMRSEIARIQHELGVTTIYVTHDQTEAMTMGDRVAVMRKGKLLQVDSPQTLYDRPVNLFVAGFIGSPAMNMVEAQLESSNGAMAVRFGEVRLNLEDELLSARPALKDFAGRNMILGIRPEDMEDASLVPGAPEDRRIGAVIDLREALGAEVLVHFTVDAPMAMTEDVKELVADSGAETPEVLEEKAREDKSVFVARLNPRTRARVGDRLDLVVDTKTLHFFDPESGEGIFDQKKD
jgi:multiple sugar transport system ATP-binding protein